MAVFVLLSSPCHFTTIEHECALLCFLPVRLDICLEITLFLRSINGLLNRNHWMVTVTLALGEIALYLVHPKLVL